MENLVRGFITEFMGAAWRHRSAEEQVNYVDGEFRCDARRGCDWKVKVRGGWRRKLDEEVEPGGLIWEFVVKGGEGQKCGTCMLNRIGIEGPR